MCFDHVVDTRVNVIHVTVSSTFDDHSDSSIARSLLAPAT